jgi:hypothetical protein
MSAFFWWFNKPPTRAETERFFERQVNIFSRYTSYLTGSDGNPVVDTFIVEHDNGLTSLEFQLNGTPGHMGDLFCFPGYYPGDTDNHGLLLYNKCDTKGHFYAKIVSFILNRAAKEFDMEWTTSERKAQSHYTEAARR